MAASPAPVVGTAAVSSRNRLARVRCAVGITVMLAVAFGTLAANVVAYEGIVPPRGVPDDSTGYITPIFGDVAPPTTQTFRWVQTEATEIQVVEQAEGRSGGDWTRPAIRQVLTPGQTSFTTSQVLLAGRHYVWRLLLPGGCFFEGTPDATCLPAYPGASQDFFVAAPVSTTTGRQYVQDVFEERLGSGSTAGGWGGRTRVRCSRANVGVRCRVSIGGIWQVTGRAALRPTSDGRRFRYDVTLTRAGRRFRHFRGALPAVPGQASARIARNR